MHIKLWRAGSNWKKKPTVIPSEFAGTHEGSDVCRVAAGFGSELPERAGKQSKYFLPAATGRHRETVFGCECYTENCCVNVNVCHENFNKKQEVYSILWARILIPAYPLAIMTASQLRLKAVAAEMQAEAAFLQH